MVRQVGHMASPTLRRCAKRAANPGGRADGNRKQRGFRALTARALAGREVKLIRRIKQWFGPVNTEALRNYFNNKLPEVQLAEDLGIFARLYYLIRLPERKLGWFGKVVVFLVAIALGGGVGSFVAARSLPSAAIKAARVSNHLEVHYEGHGSARALDPTDGWREVTRVQLNEGLFFRVRIASGAVLACALLGLFITFYRPRALNASSTSEPVGPTSASSGQSASPPAR